MTQGSSDTGPVTLGFSDMGPMTLGFSDTGPVTLGSCFRMLTITITIYFINPSGKLKLSFDRTTKNIIISIILSHEPHAHTHS